MIIYSQAHTYYLTVTMDILAGYKTLSIIHCNYMLLSLLMTGGAHGQYYELCS